jgi:hypothetical protein
MGTLAITCTVKIAHLAYPCERRQWVPTEGIVSILLAESSVTYLWFQTPKAQWNFGSELLGDMCVRTFKP